MVKTIPSVFICHGFALYSPEVLTRSLSLQIHAYIGNWLFIQILKSVLVAVIPDIISKTAVTSCSAVPILFDAVALYSDHIGKAAFSAVFNIGNITVYGIIKTDISFYNIIPLRKNETYLIRARKQFIKQVGSVILYRLRHVWIFLANPADDPIQLHFCL